MSLELLFPDQRNNYQISEEEYKAILCKVWEAWRRDIFTGRNPKEALVAAQKLLEENLSHLQSKQG